MISRVRTRALTMPPTDELRRMIEQSDKVSLRRSRESRRRRRGAGPQAGLGRPAVDDRGDERATIAGARAIAGCRRSRAAAQIADRRERAPRAQGRRDRDRRARRRLRGRRPLPHRRADRRGRHGQGLPRRARRDRQARRAQGLARELLAHARSRRAVPPRGARGLEDRPPEHRRRHRFRRHRRRQRVLRHGVPRGRRARLGDRARGRRSTSRARCASPARSAARCPRRTAKASSTAISSPRTSS